MPRREGRGMSRRDWYLATNSIVLLWIVLALVAVGVHRFVDRPLWLMVHVPLLGAASAAILIWSQHFADTLLRRPAPGGRVGLGARLGLHTLGAAAVVAGMLTDALPLAVAGAVAVGVAVLAHAGILLVQSRAALPTRFAPVVRYSATAAVVFPLGIAAGAVLAAIEDPAIGDRLVMSHLVLNAFGWIGTTVLGTLVLLWPTVLHARIPDTADAAARRALPILLVGLGIAAAGPLLDLRPLVAVGLAVWLAGAALLAREGWREARTAPPASFAGYSLAAGFGWGLATAATIAVLALAAPDWAGLREASLRALGPLVAGFAVQVLTGALSFLLPVVALGSPAAARAGARELDRGAVFRVVAFNGALLLFLLPLPSIVSVLVSLVPAAVVAAFLVLAVRALVVGRRVRREEGAHPDRSGRLLVGAPTAEAPPPRHPRTGAIAAAFTVLALCVTGGVAVDPTASGIAVASAAGEAAPTGQTTRVTVRVDGMRFTPDVIKVPAGDVLVVTFENTGADVHDLTFANGIRTQRLAPGASETIEVGVIGTDLAGWCSIAGHRQMGMELTVRAIGGVAAEGDGSGDHDHDGGSGGASAAADVDLQRDPGPGFEPWPAALAPAPDATVHRIELRVTEQVEEVAPGVTQTRWTFGGGAPGPVIRGSIGDRFEITLVNDGSIGHSIDFHAGALAPDGPMRTIQPGETLTYVFTATRAGIWMYHCSTMPMSMHIANGMFGAVIIDPPDLAPVDREYVLVQGELYLGPQGETADADAIAAIEPDLVAFNGYADQYAYRPLEAVVGERVRIWVLDAGPNLPSAFHVVGGQFDTVYLEGAYLLRPEDPGGSQALALQPAQGGFVELVFPEAGTYTFVTHRMTDAERGARGLFLVSSP